MLTLRVNEERLRTEIEQNHPNNNTATFIRTDTEAFIKIINGEKHPDFFLRNGCELVPIPASDPYGYRRKDRRFEEFTETPPSDVDIPSLKEMPKRIATSFWDSWNCELYMEYAVKNGWDTIHSDWIRSEEYYLDGLIDLWASDLRHGLAISVQDIIQLDNQYEVILT